MFKRPGLGVTFVFVTFCIGVGGIAFMVYSRLNASAPAPTATAQPAALVAVATGTPEPTATETPTERPTVDTSMFIPTQTQLAIINGFAEATRKSVNSESTVVVNKSIVATIDAARAQDTATAEAILTPTAAAIATAQEQGNRNKQQFIADQEQTTAENKRKEFFAWAWQWVGLIGVPSAIIIIGLGVNRLFKDTPTPVPTEPAITPNLAEREGPLPIQTVAPNQTFESTLKLDRIELARLQNAAINFGGVLSRRKLMKQGFTQARADELCLLLKEPDIDEAPWAVAGPNSTTVLNNKGWALVKAAPTAPQWEEPPETTENAAKTQTTPLHTTGNEAGEGAVSGKE